jgi:UDP-N-acetylmuramate--alanine ligase
VKNSLAVVALVLELGIEIDRIKDSLKKFSGTDRRFEVKYNKEIMVVDDYAHHPTEVDATLNAVKGGWNRRIITVFQPHLFSRTLEFYKEFGQVFLNTDILVCLDIYPSREEPIEGVSSTLITESARKAGLKMLNTCR